MLHSHPFPLSLPPLSPPPSPPSPLSPLPSPLSLLLPLPRELLAVLHSHQVENSWFLEVYMEGIYYMPLPVCHFLHFPPPSSSLPLLPTPSLPSSFPPSSLSPSPSPPPPPSSLSPSPSPSPSPPPPLPLPLPPSPPSSPFLPPCRQ